VREESRREYVRIYNKLLKNSKGQKKEGRVLTLFSKSSLAYPN
jgi:hypothetical protein